MDNSNPTTIIATLNSTTTNAVSPVFASAGSFYWRVRASNGALHTDSSVHSFYGFGYKFHTDWDSLVCFNQAPSIPTLISPASGSQNELPSVMFRWNAVNFGLGCSGLGNSYYLLIGDNPNPGHSFLCLLTPTRSGNSTVTRHTRVQSTWPADTTVLLESGGLQWRYLTIFWYIREFEHLLTFSRCMERLHLCSCSSQHSWLIISCSPCQ